MLELDLNGDFFVLFAFIRKIFLRESSSVEHVSNVIDICL